MLPNWGKNWLYTFRGQMNKDQDKDACKKIARKQVRGRFMVLKLDGSSE